MTVTFRGFVWSVYEFGGQIFAVGNGLVLRSWYMSEILDGIRLHAFLEGATEPRQIGRTA